MGANDVIGRVSLQSLIAESSPVIDVTFQLAEVAVPRRLCRAVRRLMIVMTAVAMAGCSHQGPTTILADRFDYAMAIGDSFKEQNLMNIVRLRYGDWPVFLNVQQVVAAYSWEQEGTLSSSLKSPFSGESDVIGGAVTGTFIERPTITYSPLTGEEFARNLLTPIRPSVLLTLIESGWPADLLFHVAVESANDLRNTGYNAGEFSKGDEGFKRLSRLLRQLQVANALVIHATGGDEKPSTLELGFRTGAMSPDLRNEYAKVKALLGLDPNANSFAVVFETGVVEPGTIALKTRSVLLLMVVLATYVDVPDAHIASGRTPELHRHRGLPADGGEANRLGPELVAPLMQIHSGPTAPLDSFVAVEYRRVSYWINDNDWQSKRVFNVLLLLSTATETGSGAAPPLVITTN